jgi:hypothetical protein
MVRSILDGPDLLPRDRPMESLPGRRHAFRFQTLRFCSLRDRRRSEALRLRWLVALRLANFGARLKNGLCDWQDRGMRRFTIENPGRPRGVRGSAAVGRAEKSDQHLCGQQATHQRFFSLWCVQANPFPFPLHPGKQSPRPADGFAVPCLDSDGQQHVRSPLQRNIACMYNSASSCSSAPRSGHGLVFCVDVAQQRSMSRRLRAENLPQSCFACIPKLIQTSKHSAMHDDELGCAQF